MKTLTQPLKWHGGKGAFGGKLAKWIISLMPCHTHYVEPYFGGGSVLLNKNPEGVSEVVNDIHGELIQFWSVLRSDEWFDLLLRTVEATPFSESMFDGCPVDNPSEMRTNEQLTRACVARAYRFFIRARQSRQGLMKDFATLSRNRTRRGMNEQVSSWLTAIEGLPDVHKRMKRVVILNRDAISVINTQDGPSTVFYLDPPYLHETRRTTQDYEYEMSPESHTQLLLKLRDIKGKFLLSGYRSELYDATASGSNWKRHEFGIVNNASSKKTKDIKTECVWTNF